jgi:hypothetical protein
MLDTKSERKERKQIAKDAIKIMLRESGSKLKAPLKQKEGLNGAPIGHRDPFR